MSTYHVMANEFFPVFTVHNERPDNCDSLCLPVTMTADEYLEYLEVMAAFKRVQEKIQFPIPENLA